MSSKVVAVKTSVPGRIEFRIEHDPADSYSRSVGPTARRALKSSPALLRKAGWAGHGPIFERDWVFDVPAPKGKAHTIVPFTFETE